MQEFGPQFDALVLGNKKRMQECDVACFVYDSGDASSFAYVANLRVSFFLFLIDFYRININWKIFLVFLLPRRVI
jgi:hypothetical protein